MNYPHIDEDCDAYWTGRLIAVVAIARTALREREVPFARTLLDGELRDFHRSTLCDEALREILREL